ncbi:nSTAND1 domain-containing NTPase [Streptomyces sp. NBC_00285]|uniref:nSTAND1 domain-containing NTPase n=1 Tax=Streptomyces sp. NBC_00285 TaxID=2975700 RepID=UPI002E2BE7D8|nr:helix-turn-helix domain-containing protein [Streptomyces sp. NBC_00285]
MDPAAGPTQRFAHELRELRQSAGSPSYRVMAQRTGASVTTLARAAAGERLPSSAVVRAYAQACDADPAEWELRWKTATEEVAAEETAARDNAEADGAEKSPYRGLARFEPGDRALFFGRGRLVSDLLDLVSERRFGAVFGPSGSGKSSLLRAGLVPAAQETARRTGRPVALRILTPGERPAATYGHLLAPRDGDPDSWVIVDQFEEVFTLCRDRAERSRFIDLLLTARDPASRLSVVIAMRADFYGRCAEVPELADALRHSSLLVGPMSPSELREAVTGPAAAAGLVVERELTARIVEEVVDQPGGLPMLSHALLETWRRRRGRILTLAGYEEVGGVHGAIAASAERMYGALTPAQARTTRRLLLRLVVPGEGTPDTRRSATRAELDQWSDPELPTVVERLAAARLLCLDGSAVDLAHEALISCWPRLSGWIDEDRERLRRHRDLTDATRTWHELGHDHGALYRGARLDRAVELFPGQGQARGQEQPQHDDLTPAERAFLTTALDVRDQEHRSAARTRKRTRRLFAALSALLAVALVTGLVAWRQHGTEVRDSEDTAARRVAETALTMHTTDPRTAMLLSVAAWRIAALPETRAALLGAMTMPEDDVYTDPGPGADARFLTDSGRVLLSATGRTWHTWDTVTHRKIDSGRLPSSPALASSPDGRVLALDLPDGAGWRLWDLPAGHWTGGPHPVPDRYLPSFASDPHTYLASEIDEPRLDLRSVTDGHVLLHAQTPSDAGIAETPDGRLVAVCPVSGPLQILDTGRRSDLTGGWTGAGENHCGDANSLLAFDSAGDRLAVVSRTGIRVWDTASGRLIADISSADASSASFSQDGKFLATTDSSRLAVWRLSAPDSPVFRHDLNGRQPSSALAWDPAKPVLRYLEAGSVHALDLGAAVTPAWHGNPLNNALLSPDGHTLATAEQSDGGYVFRLRTTSDGRLLRTLPTVPLPTPADSSGPIITDYAQTLMAFAPDGTTFAYGISAPGRVTTRQLVRIRDLSGDRTRTTLDLAASAPDTAVDAMALGPGARTLVAVRPQTTDENAEVWNTERHRRTSVLHDLHNTTLALRPDGRLLVVGNNVTALPTGPSREQALSRGDEVEALAFTTDGSRAAAGDASGRVTLWDAGLSHRLAVLPNTFPAPLAGGTPETVSALAFSPDGNTLAVAGDLGSLQLWDTASHQALSTVTTPGEGITALAFNPDGSALYSAGTHVPLRTYPVTPSYAVAQICARTAGSLSPTQWHTLIPDAGYRSVCPRDNAPDEGHSPGRTQAAHAGGASSPRRASAGAYPGGARLDVAALRTMSGKLRRLRS